MPRTWASRLRYPSAWYSDSGTPAQLSAVSNAKSQSNYFVAGWTLALSFGVTRGSSQDRLAEFNIPEQSVGKAVHLPRREDDGEQRSAADSCEFSQRCGRRGRYHEWQDPPFGAQPAHGVRAVSGELQHGCAVQLLLPVINAAGELSALKAPALPGCKVIVLNRQRRQVGRPLGAQGRIQRLQLRTYDGLKDAQGRGVSGIVCRDYHKS